MSQSRIGRINEEIMRELIERDAPISEIKKLFR